MGGRFLLRKGWRLSERGSISRNGKENRIFYSNFNHGFNGESEFFKGS